jgi:MoaA/NifB/PqqE/SkfB family radical SAM enzyme
VCDNIKQFKELKSRHNNIQLQVCSTVNVFNVYYLEELADWIAQQGFDFVYWNMMHDAYYFSIATLPEDAKHAITNQLMNAQVDDNTRYEFTRIIDFMNNGTSLDGNILRMRVKDLDRKREQNLAAVEPEFAKLIDYDYHR